MGYIILITGTKFCALKTTYIIYFLGGSMTVHTSHTTERQYWKDVPIFSAIFFFFLIHDGRSP